MKITLRHGDNTPYCLSLRVAFCSFTGNAFLISRRVLHVDGLMRSRVTRDGEKLIISTTDGYLMVIHNLDLNRLNRDLFGFNAGFYHMIRRGDVTDKPSEQLFQKFFRTKRNRVEIIDDFPMDDEPSMVPSLEVCHCNSALSRLTL